MSNGMHELTDVLVLDEVVEVLAETLGLEDGGKDLTSSSGLFGSIPELDSFAVMEVLVALENRFGVQFDDDEVTMDVFATLGSLANLVERKRAGLQ